MTLRESVLCSVSLLTTGYVFYSFRVNVRSFRFDVEGIECSVCLRKTSVEFDLCVKKCYLHKNNEA